MTIINKAKQFIIILLILLSVGGNVVYARSSADIAKEIENQKKTLEQNQKDLENAKNNLTYYNNALSSATTGVPQLEAQIKQLEAEIGLNVEKLDLLNEKRSGKKVFTQK